MKIKNICIVSGSRAEYGLLKPLIKKVKKENQFNLQLVVTGMHLSKKYGYTINEIFEDNFNVFEKVDILSSERSKTYIGESLSNGIKQFSDYFSKNKPDILIVLGDRFEIFACCIAAYFLNIPIGHINGGETTEAAFDEGIRHSITKMSHFHFTSNKVYRNRVIQLGEDPKRVFNVGGLFVDAIKESKILTKKQLTAKTNIVFKKKNLLITYHPETLSEKSPQKSFLELIKVLKKREDINLIFTLPNADPSNSKIFSLVQKFVKENPNRAICFSSLGHQNYISLLNYVDGVLGNSSSGITEAPAFQIGTINVGDRQKGRIRSQSIIDCEPDSLSIEQAINKLYSTNFKKKIKRSINPYGNGNASTQIVKILKKISLTANIQKTFYDIG